MLDNQLSIFDIMFEAEDKEKKEVSTKVSTEIEHKVGDRVKVKYGGKEYEAIVTRVYNNGDTYNCKFNSCVTAFHKSVVRK